MSDDRDSAPPKHPRLDTPTDWDEDTGVGKPPRSGSVSARAAFRKIDELGRKFDEHAKTDTEALERITVKMVPLERLPAQLDKHGDTLITLREASAGTKAALEAMTSELRHKREVQKIEVEGEITGRIKTQEIAMTNRAKIWLSLIAILAGVVGAAIKWLVG